VGEVLGKFAVGGVDDLRSVIKGHRANPRSAGIEGENELHPRQASDGKAFVTGIKISAKRNLLKRVK
jgi:hypothetical protein